MYDNGETDEGRVYIFHGSASGISTVPAATLESNQAGARMGFSVASAGDVNGDGYSDVIVGSWRYDLGQLDEGAAFIYHGSATGINIVATDTLQHNQVNSYFGCSVASAGDVNGDGYSDVIVGAFAYDSSGITDQGAAFVYHGSATRVSNTPAFTILSGLAGANLGWSVASAGDVNGDGFSDVIIGAYNLTHGLNYRGKAFVYYGSTIGITTVGGIALIGNMANANFAYSVSSAGDVNGDGYSDVIIGANYYANGETVEGAAYIYQGAATGIVNIPSTILESNRAFTYSGNAVAGAGDINGDGYSDVMVGAYQFSNGSSNEGAVYIYNGSPAGVDTVVRAVLEGNLGSAAFGTSVASAGDVNGDGFSDIIVGAKGYHNPETGEGGAFVYYGNNKGGLRNNLRLYNSDQVTPIQQSNISDQLFAAGLFAKSALGRQKGKLVIETVRNGVPFSGNPITNSNGFTAVDAAYTNLGLTGVELKRPANKMMPTKATYTRARVKYSPATAITGQLYGPWKIQAAPVLSSTVITFSWTGNINTAWENPGNWSSNTIPVATSDVTIPAGRPRYPTINVTTSIKSLSLAPGTNTITATGVTLNIIGH
jgi:hypothetical protein